jgi:hypothetical protein
MEDDTGEKSSIVIGLIENRAKEVLYALRLFAEKMCENQRKISETFSSYKLYQ